MRVVWRGPQAGSQQDSAGLKGASLDPCHCCDGNGGYCNQEKFWWVRDDVPHLHWGALAGALLAAKVVLWGGWALRWLVAKPSPLEERLKQAKSYR